MWHPSFGPLGGARAERLAEMQRRLPSGVFEARESWRFAPDPLMRLRGSLIRSSRLRWRDVTGHWLVVIGQLSGYPAAATASA